MTRTPRCPDDAGDEANDDDNITPQYEALGIKELFGVLIICATVAILGACVFVYEMFVRWRQKRTSVLHDDEHKIERSSTLSRRKLVVKRRQRHCECWCGHGHEHD
jgi:hypothetical protein